MKERPILFSAPMVRALLDGSKTQTRRIMKVQPPGEGFQLTTLLSTTGDCRKVGKHRWIKMDGHREVASGNEYFSCPYGYTLDRLWVRETHFVNDLRDPTQLSADARSGLEIFYRATDEKWLMDMEDTEGLRWTPSIHMPRWASRITLEITGVRVERLQAISEADAWAEGIEAVDGALDDLTIIRLAKSMGLCIEDAVPTYAALWESINGAGSWEANPWVWVVEFRRLP